MHSLKVKQLESAIEGVSGDVPIVFGNVGSSNRQLGFYRFDKKGDDLLHIELYEIDSEATLPEMQENRITISQLRAELERWSPDDDITFGQFDSKWLLPNNPSLIFSMELDSDNE